MPFVLCKGTMNHAEQCCTWRADLSLICATMCRGSWSSNAWGAAATTAPAPHADKQPMPVLPGTDMHCTRRPQTRLGVCARSPYLSVRWPSFCRGARTSSVWGAAAQQLLHLMLTCSARRSCKADNTAMCRGARTSSAWGAGGATWTPPSGGRPGALPRMRPCMPSMRSMGAAGAASRARCRGGRHSSAGPGGWVDLERGWPHKAWKETAVGMLGSGHEGRCYVAL